METNKQTEQCEKRLNYYCERRTYLKNISQNQDHELDPQQQQPQQKPSQDSGSVGSGGAHAEPQILSVFERSLLKKFRNKVSEFKYTLCPTCKESFPSIVLVKGECRRCYTEKTTPKKSSAKNDKDPGEADPDEADPDEVPEKLPKKFSAENNMDPGEVPNELQNLTEVEEMLIARVFPVMSVYRLREG